MTTSQVLWKLLKRLSGGGEWLEAIECGSAERAVTSLAASVFAKSPLERKAYECGCNQSYSVRLHHHSASRRLLGRRGAPA